MNELNIEVFLNQCIILVNKYLFFDPVNNENMFY